MNPRIKRQIKNAVIKAHKTTLERFDQKVVDKIKKRVAKLGK